MPEDIVLISAYISQWDVCEFIHNGRKFVKKNSSRLLLEVGEKVDFYAPSLGGDFKAEFVGLTLRDDDPWKAQLYAFRVNGIIFACTSGEAMRYMSDGRMRKHTYI